MKLSDLGPAQSKMSHLAVMLYSVAKIRDYTADGKEVFLQCTRSQDATYFRFISIVEATKHLTGEDHRWIQPLSRKKVRAMTKHRNEFAHEPNKVRGEELWDIVQKFLPLLEKALKGVPGYASLSFLDNASTDAERHVAAEMQPMLDEMVNRLRSVFTAQSDEIARTMRRAMEQFGGSDLQ